MDLDCPTGRRQPHDEVPTPQGVTRRAIPGAPSTEPGESAARASGRGSRHWRRAAVIVALAWLTLRGGLERAASSGATAQTDHQAAPRPNPTPTIPPSPKPSRRRPPRALLRCQGRLMACHRGGVGVDRRLHQRGACEPICATRTAATGLDHGVRARYARPETRVTGSAPWRGSWRR